MDSKTELAFESNAAGRRLSRILSAPGKAPWGKKGDVLLDDLAHIVNDREVYTGSTALILNEAKVRWATDFKILLQRRDVSLPRERELISQIHSIKRRVLPSGKVSFDGERTARGLVDRFWAIALACQKERGPAPRAGTEIGVRVIG